MKLNFSTLLLLPLALLLPGCDGPWNMGVEDHPADRSLWVSSVQVASRGFDTVWIEDNAAVETRYDPSTEVVTSTSVVRIFQDSAGIRDTVVFVPAVGLPRAWVPRALDAAKRVRWKADLVFAADVVLPGGSRQTLSASSYTPAFYAIADSFAVPIEALHPMLANGSMRAELLADPAAAVLKLDPQGVFLKRWKLDLSDLQAYLAGQPVMRNIAVKGPHPDTVWYISDLSPVAGLGLDGAPPSAILGEFRGWIFRHHIDRERFGGAVLQQGFDPSRARIFGSIYKQFGNTFNSTDSSGLFQRGDTRSWLVAPRVYDILPGWPDSALLTNTYLGYTGRNRIYSWSVDSLYFEYTRALAGETGDGQYTATNIKGGRGYFTGAAKDSVSFDLEASFPDTVSVSRLQKLWCDSVVVRKARGKNTQIPDLQVQLFCGD